jgi:hypothetical protein
LDFQEFLRIGRNVYNKNLKYIFKKFQVYLDAMD